MARAPTSIQAITANRLNDGRVVFLSATGWDTKVDAAEIFPDAQTAQGGLERAMASVAAGDVVEPYAIAVIAADQQVTPVLLRERIRAEGPTIAPGDVAA
jgi:hypothetical protein